MNLYLVKQLYDDGDSDGLTAADRGAAPGLRRELRGAEKLANMARHSRRKGPMSGGGFHRRRMRGCFA